MNIRTGNKVITKIQLYFDYFTVSRNKNFRILSLIN